MRAFLKKSRTPISRHKIEGRIGQSKIYYQSYDTEKLVEITRTTGAEKTTDSKSQIWDNRFWLFS